MYSTCVPQPLISYGRKAEISNCGGCSYQYHRKIWVLLDPAAKPSGNLGTVEQRDNLLAGPWTISGSGYIIRVLHNHYHHKFADPTARPRKLTTIWLAGSLQKPLEGSWKTLRTPKLDTNPCSPIVGTGKPPLDPARSRKNFWTP